MAITSGDYIVSADVTGYIPSDELIYVTDTTNNPPTTRDDSVVSSGIVYAEGEVKSRVGASYDLEMKSDSKTSYLKLLCLQILREYLWEHSKKAMPESVRNLAMRARASLKEIASKDGTRTLGARSSFDNKQYTSVTSTFKRG